MTTFKGIQVLPGTQVSGVVYQVEFMNPTPYRFIGAGAQGAVFQLSPNQCVKIYPDETDTQLELSSLQAASSASFIPKVYEAGANYIVMELINGVEIKSYLSEFSTLPDFIAEQLLLMIREMKRVGFTRIDAALRHVFVTSSLTLKVVDHVNSYRTIQPYPIQMLQGLTVIGYLQPFLHYVELHEPALMTEWQRAQIIPMT